MARELIIPFLITANYQTSLAIRQLRGELGQLPAELTALRAAAAEVYAIGAMGLFSMGMLAAGAQQLASSLVAAQRMAALAAIASGQFAGATAVSSQILSEAASLASKTSVSINEIASAFLEAARAGLSLGEASALLPEAINVAVVSGGDLAEVFRMTFAIMRNMGIPVTQQTARTISSELSYALDQSLMDIEDVMHAFKYAGPIAGQLQVPLHDLIASLMILHDAGIRASIAGTGLARMLVRLEAPTGQARRRLQEIGLDFHKLRPSANNLADILDTLASHADALTIRLLLGERAERAFYAIIQQGTHRLRQYAAQLQQIGVAGDYAQKKLEALYRTPVGRLTVALNQIRTSATVLVEPIVRLQTSLAETFASFMTALVDSPALRILSKFVVGFVSVAGTATLAGATISWLAGRFLELGTIWHHLLLVIDRLQASMKALTMSALKTPLLGLAEGFRALVLPFGGGLERLAEWVSARLRISELASAISQPLVFWRRARRVPPLLQPLPEHIAMHFGNMAAAAQRLGIPIEQFLMAGVTFGPLRPTRIRFNLGNVEEFVQRRFIRLLNEADQQIALEVANAIVGTHVNEPLRLVLGTTVLRAAADLARELPLRSSFMKFYESLIGQLFDRISKGEIVDEQTLRALGFQGAAVEVFSQFANQVDKAFRGVIFGQARREIARALLRRPEFVAARAVSSQAADILRMFEIRASRVPLDAIGELMKDTVRAVEAAISEANKQAFPFLREYQQKVAAVLRSANLPQSVRTFLLGAAALPADEFSKAFQISLGAMTGLAIRKLPTRPDRFSRAISRLTNEFAAFFADVPDLFDAATRLGLAFGSALKTLPEAKVIRDLIRQRSKRLSALQELKLFGLASAEQIAEITQLQQEIGLLTGMLVAKQAQKIHEAAIRFARGARAPQQIREFLSFIRRLPSKEMQQLRNALLQLGYDVPEVIARLLREGAPFARLLREQMLEVFGSSEELRKQFTEFMRVTFRARRELPGVIPVKIRDRLMMSLSDIGLTADQIGEIMQSLSTGLLLSLAESQIAAAQSKEAKNLMNEATRNIQARASSFARDFIVAARFVGIALTAAVKTPFAAIVSAVEALFDGIKGLLRMVSSFSVRSALQNRHIRQFNTELVNFFSSLVRIFADLVRVVGAFSIGVGRMLRFGLLALKSAILGIIDPRFIQSIKSFPTFVTGKLQSLMGALRGFGSSVAFYVRALIEIASILSKELLLDPISTLAKLALQSLAAAQVAVAGQIRSAQARVIAIARAVSARVFPAVMWVRFGVFVARVMGMLILENIKELSGALSRWLSGFLSPVVGFIRTNFRTAVTQLLRVLTRLTQLSAQVSVWFSARSASISGLVNAAVARAQVLQSSLAGFFRILARIIRISFDPFVRELRMLFTDVRSFMSTYLMRPVRRLVSFLLSSIRSSLQLVPQAFNSLRSFFVVSLQDLFKSLGRWARSSWFGKKVAEPIAGVLSLLPQFLLGLDIKRFINFGAVGRALSGVLKFSIAGFFVSFLLEIVPWEELVEALHLPTQWLPYLQRSGSLLRKSIGAAVLSIGTILKSVVWDIPASLIDIIRGRGFTLLSRLKETFRWLVTSIDQMFKVEFREMQYLKDQAEIATRLSFQTVVDTARAFADSLINGIKVLSSTAASIRLRLSELGRLLGLTGEIVPAPIGIGHEWVEIGRFASSFTTAFEEYYDAVKRFAGFERMRMNVLNTSSALIQRARTLSGAFSSLANFGLKELEKLPSGDVAEVIKKLPPEVAKAFGDIFADFMANAPGSMLYELERLRAQLIELPPEQRAQAAGTIAWLTQITGKLREHGNFLAYYLTLTPQQRQKMREELQQRLSELANLLSPEQIQASLIDPIRTALEELGDTLSEQIQRLSEIVDPTKLREIALSISEQQFEFLTEGHRLAADVARAQAEFLEALSGNFEAASVNVAAAESLAQAWFNVIDALSRPAPRTWQEALQVLSSAFEAIGSEQARIKVAELQRLLAQYNFMTLTPEAAMQVRKRIAELGKEVLDEFRKLRESLADLADDFKRLSEEYAEAWTFAAPEMIDRAVVAEQAYLNAVNREASLRAEMMRKLGKSEAEITAAINDFYARALTRLYFLRRPSLEQLQTYFTERAEFAEQIGEDYFAAFVDRERAASIAYQRAQRWMTMAWRAFLRAGGVTTRAVLDYIAKARQAFRQVFELSIDARVAAFGLQAAWKEISDAISGFGDTLSGLMDKVNLFWLVFSSGYEKLNSLWVQIARFLSFGTIGARIKAIQLLRQFREVWKTLFPEPEEVAEAFESFAGVLQRFIEQGYVPAFFGVTMPQVRATYAEVLRMLWFNYALRFQQITALMQQVPVWSRTWLELFSAQIKVVEALANIEERLRQIRMEMLSLELYAVPERVSEFIIQQGPALQAFLRTGPTTGISTIQFSINIYAQDVSAGVQQALYEAQRRLQGFSMQPVF